ncbi:MAG: hypothetical protein Q7J30_00980 [Candidatus Azambacteria bacterium]|nr:hypothetical protein [Candidatus Azambacteria bacterium]
MEEILSSIQGADELFGKFLRLGRKITIAGYQLSSGTAVIINCAGEKNVPNFVKLRALWQNRKNYQ